jgi:hypothetical protein
MPHQIPPSIPLGSDDRIGVPFASWTSVREEAMAAILLAMLIAA